MMLISPTCNNLQDSKFSKQTGHRAETILIKDFMQLCVQIVSLAVLSSLLQHGGVHVGGGRKLMIIHDVLSLKLEPLSTHKSKFFE